MLAAEKLVPVLAAGRSHDEVVEIENEWRDGPIGADLKPVRNVKPLWSKYGTLLGIGLGGIDMWLNQLFGWSPFGTLKHGKPDHATLKLLSEVKPIVYPKPDGKISFDKLSSVFLSSTNHEEDQPAHLKLTDPSIPIEKNLPLYGEPRGSTARRSLLEVVYKDAEAKTEPRFVINAQNCVHCKTCDIKDPAQNITWTVPEGGGGRATRTCDAAARRSRHQKGGVPAGTPPFSRRRPQPARRRSALADDGRSRLLGWAQPAAKRREGRRRQR